MNQVRFSIIVVVLFVFYFTDLSETCIDSDLPSLGENKI